MSRSDFDRRTNLIEGAALEYMARGWAVFPVNGKIPCTSNGVLDASTEQRMAAIWFERFPERGVALATGKPSGVWALDLDSEDAAKRWAAIHDEHGGRIKTVVSKTRRGYHLLFKMPTDGTDIRNSAGQVGDGIDVRGSGGYIVLPPSPHPDDGVYGWAKGRAPGEIDIADTPDWLTAVVTEKQTGPAQPAPALSGMIPEGGRNATLTSVAGTMQRRGMSREAILAALQKENEGRCNPPLPNDEVERIADSVSRYEPAPQAPFNGLGPAPASEDPWPEHPRLPGPPSPDPFPLDALPPALRRLVDKVHLSLQVPVELPATLALAVLSASVGGKLVIEVGGTSWSERVVLYTVVILPPASRKSPVFQVMVRPLGAWEKEEVKRAAPKILAAQDVVEVRAKDLQNTKAAASKGNATLEEVEAARESLSKAEAKVPQDPRLLAGDITTEEMGRRLAAQGGRLAILEPEGGPLRGLERYTDGGAQLEEVKKAWSGETIRVDRVGREPVFIEHPALTLGLTLQPGVLESLRNARAFRGEGVLGRILFTIPPHGLGSRLTGPDVPPLPPEAEADYGRVVERLLSALPQEVGEGGGHIPHRLRLSNEALNVLYAYQREVELELGDGARFSGIRDWAGKVVGQSIRIAALLELALRAENDEELWEAPVSKWAMESGVQLARMFASHALVVFGEMEMDSRLLMASRVLRKIREAPITLADLWRSMRNTKSLESVGDLHDVVDDLQERGCIRLVQAPSRGGRRPSPEIELHPKLRASDSDRHPLNALKAPEEDDGGTLVDKVDAHTLSTDDKSDKSEGGVEELSEEDRQYLEDERAGIQMEALDLEPVSPPSAVLEGL